MFQKIDHVELNTQDPERAVAFYTGVIGFREKLRQHIPLSGGSGTLDIVYLELNGTAIEVLTYAGPPMAPAPQGLHLGYQLLALAVDSMQETLAALKTHGIEPVWGPATIDRYIRAEISDPDGNRVELRQWFA